MVVEVYVRRPTGVLAFEHTGFDKIAIGAGVEIGVVIRASTVELIAVSFGVIVEVVLAHQVLRAYCVELGVEVFVVIRDTGVPVERTITGACESQFLLKVLP